MAYSDTKAHVRHATNRETLSHKLHDKVACLTWQVSNVWWVAQLIFWIKTISICCQFFVLSLQL